MPCAARILLPCLLLGLAGGMLGCGAEAHQNPDEVTVFAAASLRDALQELGATFEAETGVAVLFNFAGSHVLARQVVAASRADLYLSADERWMDSVAVAGRLVPGTRRTLLSNRLVVVAHPKSAYRIQTPCDLAALDFKYLALGDPEAVPAGRYARAWLAGCPCAGTALWDAVAPRVAPAPDVRSALSLALADPEFLAIVYKTDWRAFEARARLLYEVPVGEGPAIRYALAQVTAGPQPAAARRFLDFLASPVAAAVFEKHGFERMNEDAFAAPVALSPNPSARP